MRGRGGGGRLEDKRVSENGQGKKKNRSCFEGNHFAALSAWSELSFDGSVVSFFSRWTQVRWSGCVKGVVWRSVGARRLEKTEGGRWVNQQKIFCGRNIQFQTYVSRKNEVD